MTATPLQTVMWDWNVTALDFPGQLAATAEAGFDVLSVPMRKIRKERESGRKAVDMLAMARDHGVRLDFIDGFSGWSPVRYPDGDAFMKEALDFSVDEAFEVCDAFELKNIVAITAHERGTEFPLSPLVDAFGQFCDKAASLGIGVDLEPMAMLGIPDMQSAINIVQQSKCQNARIMFDSWHFIRNHESTDMLKQLPRGMITNVQLVDGALSPRGSNMEDAMHNRLLPGEGELPLVELLSILLQTQDIESIGPEAISDELLSLPAAEIGRRARQAQDSVMRAAGIPVS